MIRDHFLFTALIPRARLKNHGLEEIVRAIEDGTDVLFVSDEVSAESFLDPMSANFIGQNIASRYTGIFESRAERALQGSALKDETV